MTCFYSPVTQNNGDLPAEKGSFSLKTIMGYLNGTLFQRLDMKGSVINCTELWINVVIDSWNVGLNKARYVRVDEDLSAASSHADETDQLWRHAEYKWLCACICAFINLRLIDPFRQSNVHLTHTTKQTIAGALNSTVTYCILSIKAFVKYFSP